MIRRPLFLRKKDFSMKQTRFQQITTQLFTGLVIAILVDSMWIGLVAKNLYLNNFADILAAPNLLPNQWIAAIAAWFLLVLGIVIFVLPKTPTKSLYYTAGQGCLFGLVIYGCYDFTNFAILHHWPLKVVVIDVLWGCFLTTLITTILAWMQAKQTK
jgi:uncharacterized membrane protein